MIAVTNLPDLYERYMGMDAGYKYVNITLGFHPELIADCESQISIFERCISKARYIGEIGLDYTEGNERTRDKQKDVFSTIIAMARRENDKIVTVHSRKAEKDILDCMRDFPGTIILHWYSGSISNLNRAIEEEKYFSINQQMFRSGNGRKLIEHMPIDRILMESDAPFTKGLEKNYTTNFMKEIYKEVSVIKGVSIDELQMIFKDNFRRILTKNR